MMNGLIFQYRLRRLRASKRSVTREYRRKYEEAKKIGETEASDALEQTIHNREMELSLIDDEISQLVTSRLLSLAEDNLIPTPPLNFVSPNAAWEQSILKRHYHLTTAAAADLRAAIRKEQRERSELFFKWLSGLTGLVGAAIGLIALLARMH